MKKIFTLMAILMIASCMPSFQLKKMGNTKIWDSYTVAVEEDINELKTEKSILWTQNGPILEMIEFWKPLSSGDTLPINFSPKNGKKAPTYRADMTPEEIAELIRASFSLSPLVLTSMGDLKPQKFGSKPGYRVNLNLSSQKGDDFRSEILFSSIENRLYAIYLSGRSTHYFQARKPVFDRIIASIQF